MNSSSLSAAPRVDRERNGGLGLGRLFKRLCRSTWCLRNRIPFLDVGIPCRLVDGSRVWAYGDVMGWTMLNGSLRKASNQMTDWQFISGYLQPGMIVFDIGANQGLYSLLASRYVGSEGRVYAFEPASTEFAKLKRNILANGGSNVILEHSAVGSYEGNTEFYLCLSGRGSYSSRRPPAEDVRKAAKQRVQVPMVTLDRYFAENHLSSCDFIKVDVEGGERDVLRGAAHVLTHQRPLVMCELADIRTLQWGYSADEIYCMLKDFRYEWYRLSEGGRLTPAETRNSDPDGENLIAVPLERKIQLGSLLRAS